MSKNLAKITTKPESFNELSVGFEFDENTQEGRDFAREFALWILEEYGQHNEAVNWANGLLSILDNLPELK